ncbi:hypothetical protein ABZ705_28135 [Streptomyces sp. NPDC006984]|uniref:hypothetical protein n=1 Tax=Streptomyces sp. NPDC006984 TaxID=3155463 RepID=UPI0034094935
MTTWDEGEVGWSGARLVTRGQTTPGDLFSVEFTPYDMGCIGPYLELRFEASMEGVSIGEVSQVFQVHATRLVPVA